MLERLSLIPVQIAVCFRQVEPLQALAEVRVRCRPSLRPGAPLPSDTESISAGFHVCFRHGKEPPANVSFLTVTGDCHHSPDSREESNIFPA